MHNINIEHRMKLERSVNKISHSVVTRYRVEVWRRHYNFLNEFEAFLKIHYLDKGITEISIDKYNEIGGNLWKANRGKRRMGWDVGAGVKEFFTPSGNR